MYIGGNIGRVYSNTTTPMPNTQAREKRRGRSRRERREEKTREGVIQEGFEWNLVCRHAQIRGYGSEHCSLC